MELDDKIIENFWERVEKTPEGCWKWKGSTRDEYGTLGARRNGKFHFLSAHRISWHIHFGPPGELFVLHHCDNPPCTNPEHLFLGTHKENMDDMRSKNRQFRKLTDEQIKEAKSRVDKNESITIVAESLGVDRLTLKKYLDGRTSQRKPVRLSQEDYLAIKEALNKPYYGIGNDLARKYRVSHSIISHIRTGRHVPADIMKK